MFVFFSASEREENIFKLKNAKSLYMSDGEIRGDILVFLNMKSGSSDSDTGILI